MIDLSVRTLLLIRHGQYLSSSEYPQRDGGLTTLGREQAQLTANMCSSLPVTAIHHSTLPRAIEAAKIIGSSLPSISLSANPLLRECVPVVPRMDTLSLQWQQWINSLELSPEESRSNANQSRKAYRWLFRNAEERGLEIVVSSGNLISYLVARAFGAPAQSWIRTRVDLCSITAIAVTSNRGPNPLVQSIGNTEHLPQHLRLFH